MAPRKWWLLIATCGLAAVGLISLLWSLPGTPVQAATRNVAALTPVTLNRPEDPVVLTGAQLPGFMGAPLAELVGYIFEAGVWRPIPFQIDELDASGKPVAFEDGVLDDNDELVFMGGDVGEGVSADNWVADPASRLYVRYRVLVSDPLDPNGQGWVYVYRSATLPHSEVRYVAWDTPSQTMTTTNYLARFTPDAFLGLADLYLNGVEVDILDRQKANVQAEICVFIVCNVVDFNEESLTDSQFITEPLIIDWTIVGPVRATGDAGFVGGSAYRSSVDLQVVVNLSDIHIPGLTIDFLDVSTSFDLNDPLATGFAPATYYNSQLSAGVAIDGSPDAIAPTPLVDWYEVSGAWGGYVVALPIGLAQDRRAPGELRNIYHDDAVFDPNDTGDGRSFGSAGLGIDDPFGVLNQRVAMVVLPGGAGNVGDAVLNRLLSPLTASPSAETYLPPTPTPTPSLTPTATATATPTSTPSPTPTPTATPTPPGIYLPVMIKP